MSGITQILSQVLGQQAIGSISKRLGLPPQMTQMVVSAGLPLLMKALARNSATPEGAQSLYNAVEKDHDGGIFDKLEDLIGNPDSGTGAGILRHVLGSQQVDIFHQLSKSTGAPEGGVQQIFKMLAPLVMGSLGKEKQQQRNLDPSGLAALLGGVEKTMEKEAPRDMGFIGKLLDKDGDGRIDDDLAGIGMKVLGSLFKK